MDRSRRLFAPLTSSFSTAFPTLESVSIKYTSSEMGHNETLGYWNFSQQGGLIRCQNPRCQRGGYELEHIVSGMISEHLAEKSFRLHCPGYEGTPKGRHIGESCAYSISGTIKIKYKAKSS
jgi:hypothetical protein